MSSSSGSKKRAAAEELPAVAPPTDRHRVLLAQRKMIADKLVQWASELPAQNLVPDPRFAVDLKRVCEEDTASKRIRVMQYADAISLVPHLSAANFRMARFLAVLLSDYTMMVPFAEFREKLFLCYGMFQRAIAGAEFCIVLNHLEKSVMWLVLIILHATVRDEKFKGVWRLPSAIMLGMDSDLKSVLKASRMPCVYIDDGSFGGGQLLQLVEKLANLNLHAVIPYMTRRAKENPRIVNRCVLHTAVELPSFKLVFDRILETRCIMYPEDTRFDDFKKTDDKRRAADRESSASSSARPAADIRLWGSWSAGPAAFSMKSILTPKEETLFYEEDVPFLYSLLYPNGYDFRKTMYPVNDVSYAIGSLGIEEKVQGKMFADIDPKSRSYVKRVINRFSYTQYTLDETKRVVDDATAKKHVLELMRFVNLWIQKNDRLDSDQGVRALAVFEHRIADYASVPVRFFNFVFRKPGDPPTRDSYAVFLREKKAELEAILGAEYEELDHVGVGAGGDLASPARPADALTVLARMQRALDRLKLG